MTTCQQTLATLQVVPKVWLITGVAGSIGAGLLKTNSAGLMNEFFGGMRFEFWYFEQ